LSERQEKANLRRTELGSVSNWKDVRRTHPLLKAVKVLIIVTTSYVLIRQRQRASPKFVDAQDNDECPNAGLLDAHKGLALGYYRNNS
jgi:hypothetical protein